MASSLATVASASVTKPSPPAAALHQHRHDSLSSLSFPLSLNPKLKLRFFSKGLQSSQSRSTSTMLRSELNEGTADGSSNDAATPTGSEFSPPESRDSKPSNEPASAAVASEESISEFITQVASLVKLVDSRDVVELQMKQLDCEVIIRKKEAMPQPPSPAPISMVHSSQPALAPPPTAPTLPAPASSAPAQLPSTPARKSSKSSLPPLKSPMAGTFYRSPAPGEPAFVKVGDKVLKGQVLCIIEAMKLMNEIEADQSGTIVEVVAEDGKPVSVDTPLFVIQP